MWKEDKVCQIYREINIRCWPSLNIFETVYFQRIKCQLPLEMSGYIQFSLPVSLLLYMRRIYQRHFHNSYVLWPRRLPITQKALKQTHISGGTFDMQFILKNTCLLSCSAENSRKKKSFFYFIQVRFSFFIWNKLFRDILLAAALIQLLSENNVNLKQFESQLGISDFHNMLLVIYVKGETSYLIYQSLV